MNASSRRLAATPRWQRGFVPPFSLVSLLVTLLACASTPTVTREPTRQESDLSGFWNDNDSQLVSEELVRDCLARRWYTEWRTLHGARPRVIVDGVRNLSHEHLNTSTFIKDLERELINSGRVSFVASSDQRNELRAERRDQADNARLDTVKSMGRELGADVMLIGQIDQILDSTDGRQVRYYQVDLELVDLESNEKLWIGQKKIKKLVETPGYRF